MGRRRAFPRVEAIPFVGGSLCLDLANTTGARASGIPRERLSSVNDMIVWGRRAGLVSAREATRLKAAARRRRRDAKRAVDAVRTLREELHQLFGAIADGRKPGAEQLERLARRWRAVRGRQHLVKGADGYELRTVAGADGFGQMLWPIVASAVELLTSDRVRLVKRCTECDWLFVDDSKNGSRRWCKATCGNRARARARYARQSGRDLDASLSRPRRVKCRR